MNKSYFSKFLIIFALFSASVSIFTYIFEQTLIDSFFEENENELLLYIFGTLTIIGLICRFLYPYVLAKAKGRLRLLLNQKLLKAITYESIVGAEQNFLAKSTYDIEKIIKMDFVSKINITTSVCTYICAYIYIFFSSWIIGLISFSFMIICYVQNLIIGNKISKLVAERGKQNMKLVSVSRNFFENLSIIKQLNAEQKFLKRYYETTEEHDKTTLLLEKKYCFYQTLNAVTYFLQKFSIIVIGALLFYHLLITPGQLSIFIIMSSLLSQPLIVLSENIQNIKGVKTLKTTFYEQINKVTTSKINCIIENNDIVIECGETINYSDKVILEPFIFKLDEGGKYMIIGSNGSGKTTFLKHLFVNLIENSYYKKRVSFINEKTGLFDGNILDNVTLNDSIEQKDIISSFKMMNIIDAEKFLYQNAKTVSSGEAQKTIIVREILHKKNIFLLDEAFSNVDKESYLNIITFMLNSSNTLLYVTHDFDIQLMKMFSGIIYIEDKTISLCTKKGGYKAIYEKFKYKKQ